MCAPCFPRLQSAHPCAMGITQRHMSPSSHSTTKAPISHQHLMQESMHTELKGARICRHRGSHKVQSTPLHRLPMLPPASQPCLPLLGAGLGTPSRLRAICPVLSPPLSSPLSTSSHNCRTPDGQAGLQPCRDPATARAPPPSPPASSSLAAAHPGSHKDSCRVTTEGRRSTGTIADAHSERHTHTLDFSQPGGCSAPTQGQLVGLMCNALACDTGPH